MACQGRRELRSKAEPEGRRPREELRRRQHDERSEEWRSLETLQQLDVAHE